MSSPQDTAQNIQSFAEESAKAIADLVSGVGVDAGDAYRRMDIARHLTKLQIAALRSNAPEDAQRFFSELESRTVEDSETPTEDQLAEFRGQVQSWFRLDDELKTLTKTAKTKRTARDELRDLVLQFMRRFNVDELNTQQGALRHEVVKRKKGVSKAEMRDRIAAFFQDDPTACEELQSRLFCTVDDEDKHSLRRVAGA